MWPVWDVSPGDDEVTPPRVVSQKITEMNMSDKKEPPECSRCKRPNAEFRVGGEACCELCITLWESLKKFNKGVFDARS